MGRSPRDVDALIAAADAAAATGDEDAAIGFFRRAAVVAPADQRVLTGLARALYRTGDPVGALLVYARAEQSGPLPALATADRGLAYDLVGDNARAQRSYRQALTLTESAEITRRLALSQAIAGDSRAAEATLRPLLQQQDKAGWRTRAFVFAIAGEVDQAVTVAKTLLPGDLAVAITPYLRFMPRLTRAQQAAAANLGIFPAASAIGHDDPRIARYGGGAGSAAFASADLPLAPVGMPLGPRTSASPLRDEGGRQRARTKGERAAEAAMRTAPPEPPPAQRISNFDAPEGGRPDDAPATSRPTPLAGVRVPQLAIIAGSAADRPSSRSTSPQPTTPRLILPQWPSPQPALAQPASSPPMSSRRTSARPPSSRSSLADAFGDIGEPDMPSGPRPDAVDISRIDADRAAGSTSRTSAAGSRLASGTRSRKPAPTAKIERAPPSHPSRIWVQLGVGRDHQAMVSDWRRMARQQGSVLDGRQPFISDNGGRDRMLTGPFATEAAARTFVAQLDAAGFSGPYVWISPAGQVVDALEPN